MKKIIYLVSLFSLLILLAGHTEPIQNVQYPTYFCNVECFNIKTKINISKSGNNYGIIEGDFTFMVDPLTLIDTNQNKIGYAGDSYKFIGQDSHGIYVNNEFVCDMVGQVTIFGEEYKIYNKEKELIATASFNNFGTNGNIKDINDNTIASLSSSSSTLNYDYNIIVYDTNLLNENAILLICASYASDFLAD